MVGPRLNILVCAYTCSPTGEGERFGGGEDILGWNIIQQISKFHNVKVLAHVRNKSSVEDFLAKQLNSSLEFHYFELPSMFAGLLNIQGGIQFYAFLWQIKAFFEARRLHGQYGFDIFHHVTYANDWMASYIGAILPVRYVRGPGGGAHKTPKHFLNQYDIKGRIWERVRSVGQFLFRHDPFFILGQQKAKAIIVCNKEAANAIPAKWHSKTHMLAVCGVSSEELAELPDVEQNGKTFSVISAGKLLQIKGFSLAIRAFADFATGRPDSVLTIAGEGPELGNLKRLASKLGVEGQVQFVGWLPRYQLIRAMASSDVFLFPSLRDGGGAVVVEAMAVGTPVVCLDLSGPGMHVTGDSGAKIPATFPEDSVRGMSRALTRICEDSAYREHISKGAHERAQSIYHWDRVGDRINDIYTNIMRSNTN